MVAMIKINLPIAKSFGLRFKYSLHRISGIPSFRIFLENLVNTSESIDGFQLLRNDEECHLIVTRRQVVNIRGNVNGSIDVGLFNVMGFNSYLADSSKMGSGALTS